MKTPEDEAFDELARKQGAWGGGFTAKRQAAMDKINSEFHEEYIKYRTAFPKEYTAPQPAHCQCTACKDGILHASDCAVHNMPAYPAGPCDCGVAQEPERKALKLALEVMQINLTLLKKVNPYKGQEDLVSDSLDLTHKAIASIKEALAQPAQKPVAWTLLLTGEHHGIIGAAGEKFIGAPEYYERVDVYTTPPQRKWVGLTDEEIAQGNKESWVSEQAWQSAVWWAEAKLKEKNT